MLNYLKSIIKEICEEEKIDYRILSKDYIIRLEKNGKLGFVFGSMFSINSDTSSKIASDKYATYEVLKDAKIPVIEHKIVFNPKSRGRYESDLKNEEEIKKYLESHENKSLVVKPNDGFGGRNVFLCKNVIDVKNSMNTIFERKDSLSICPFYDIEMECRVIMLDGVCMLAYGKKKSKDNWKFNLSQGASVIELNDVELVNKLYEIAKNAVNAIGLRFASVDIIKLKTGELKVIEVNSGVTINKYTKFVDNGREIAKEIYKKAIELMLK